MVGEKEEGNMERQLNLGEIQTLKDLGNSKGYELLSCKRPSVSGSARCLLVGCWVWSGGAVDKRAKASEGCLHIWGLSAAYCHEEGVIRRRNHLDMYLGRS